MSWFDPLRRRFERPADPARPRRSLVPEPPPLWRFLETSRFVALTILFATVAAILMISYVGVSPVALPVQENQLAAVRIVAADTFEYSSVIRTRQAQEQASNRIPPVYHLEFAPFEQFVIHIRELAADLDRFEQSFLSSEPANRAEAIKRNQRELSALVENFNAKGPYHATTEDLVTILGLGHARFRFTAFENGLATLRELYREGVYDETHDLTVSTTGIMTAYQVLGPGGDPVLARVQSREEALTFLRINLAAEGVGREGAMALLRLFRNGLTANLAFDSAATGRLRARAAQNQRPVVVTVPKGEVLVEPGVRVTPEQNERIVAHRHHLLSRSDIQVSGQLQLFGRMLLVLAMVLGAVYFIRMEDRESLRSNSRLGMLALVVILNLALVRLVFQLGDLPFLVEHPEVAAALPYLAPTALAPMIVAVLLGSGPALFMALVISLFTGVIHGNRLDVLVVTFFASIVGISACRQARRRGVVIHAGFLAGLCVAVFALLLGGADNVATDTPVAAWAPVVARQMGAGLVTGLLTGMAVVSLIPLLEALFRRTTDITLLELTDFNHPLLNLMQLEAPGTYHHSLMVANLAENAASAIGANPLVCRTCALFHDIGKTEKPAYFNENQRDRANPHDDCPPTVSAMVIREHVRAGVELAQRHHLPRLVIDAIRQHHGTTLIQFFYQRAKKDARTPAPGPSTAGAPPAEVSEEHFRYDGPKPRTRENAILSLADCIEAASRSLRTVTPPHLSELIERLVKERIDDGQLDECPITFEEIAKIKTSFEFTLLNMLHSRIAYPVGDSAPGASPPPPAVNPSPSDHARQDPPASGQNL